MADNIPVTPGAGAIVATDDVSGAQYQRVKLDAGGDGVAVPLVAGQQARAASLPVVLATEDIAALAPLATQPISAASLPLPAGAATEATLAAVQAILQTNGVTIRRQPVSSILAQGQITTSGDTTILAIAPAGQRHIIYEMHIQSESATAVTVLIKHGPTVVDRVRLAADGDGLRVVYAPGREVSIPNAVDLTLNLSTAATVGWSVRYVTEAV